MRKLSSNLEFKQNNQYLYILNFANHQKPLCDLEIKSIFGFVPENKYFVTNIYINPARSVFIRSLITITHKGNSLEELVKSIEESELYYDDYKITYLKLQNDIQYEERLNALRMVGNAIEGDFSLTNPKTDLAITKINQTWIFGHYLKNNGSLKNRNQKPFSYSYALDHLLAKSLVNIAIGNDYGLRVVDPCCGIGTTLIEARKMGIPIKGFDINDNVVYKCNRNLAYFGFKGDVEQKNIVDIKEDFDVAIVDLPYGKFSTSTLADQKIIIKSARRIAKKVIFVTLTEMNHVFIEHGFTVIDNCLVHKNGQFSRCITICE